MKKENFIPKMLLENKSNYPKMRSGRSWPKPKSSKKWKILSLTKMEKNRKWKWILMANLTMYLLMEKESTSLNRAVLPYLPSFRMRTVTHSLWMNMAISKKSKLTKMASLTSSMQMERDRIYVVLPLKISRWCSKMNQAMNLLWIKWQEKDNRCLKTNLGNSTYLMKKGISN